MTIVAALLNVIRHSLKVSLALLQKPTHGRQIVFSFVSSIPIQFHIGVKSMKLTDVQKVIGSHPRPRMRLGNPVRLERHPRLGFL